MLQTWKRLSIAAVVLGCSTYLLYCKTTSSNDSTQKSLSSKVSAKRNDDGSWAVVCKGDFLEQYKEYCTQAAIEKDNVCLGQRITGVKIIKETWAGNGESPGENCLIKAGTVIPLAKNVNGSFVFVKASLPGPGSRLEDGDSRIWLRNLLSVPTYSLFLLEAVPGCRWAQPNVYFRVPVEDVQLLTTGPEVAKEPGCKWQAP